MEQDEQHDPDDVKPAAVDNADKDDKTDERKMTDNCVDGTVVTRHNETGNVLDPEDLARLKVDIAKVNKKVCN
jgi:hypothetical protein